MKHTGAYRFDCPSVLQSGLAVSGLAAMLFAFGIGAVSVAQADDNDPDLRPGNLLLSRVVYDNNPNNVTAGVTVLPPGCTGSGCVKATAGGTYPTVFNNASVDGSFGITSKIVLDQLTRSGDRVSSIEVPNSSQRGVTPNADQMVSSFSSKSELALNLSADKQSVTFMGYLAAVDTMPEPGPTRPPLSKPRPDCRSGSLTPASAHGSSPTF